MSKLNPFLGQFWRNVEKNFHLAIRSRVGFQWNLHKLRIEEKKKEKKKERFSPDDDIRLFRASAHFAHFALATSFLTSFWREQNFRAEKTAFPTLAKPKSAFRQLRGDDAKEPRHNVVIPRKWTIYIHIG